MKDSWNDYLIDGTNVLKNKFNITNDKELHEKEKEIVLEKLALLDIEPIKGNFDAEHLKKFINICFLIYIFLQENLESVHLLKQLEIFMIQL